MNPNENRPGAIVKRLVPFALILTILGLALSAGTAFAFAASSRTNLPAHRLGQAVAASPADLFIRSVVTRDGALGWRQLCHDVQAQVTEVSVREQADAQRAAEAGTGVRLTADFVGTRPASQGGQIRLYLLTAHGPQGVLGQRTYVVHTGAAGCVEDVQNV